MDDDDEASAAAHQPGYKAGNTDGEGNYIIGKGRPPVATRFATGDGRKRGRRPKGQRNFDTEFAEEATRKITVRENGQERKVTKLRAAIMRALSNASAGQNPAINTVLTHSARIADKPAPSTPVLSEQESAVLDGWLNDRLAAMNSGPEPGDPEFSDGAPSPSPPAEGA